MIPYKIGKSANLRQGNAIRVRGFPLGVMQDQLGSEGKASSVLIAIKPGYTVDQVGENLKARTCLRCRRLSVLDRVRPAFPFFARVRSYLAVV